MGEAEKRFYVLFNKEADKYILFSPLDYYSINFVMLECKYICVCINYMLVSDNCVRE